MPELPEVETTVKGLKKEVIGKKIIKIWTDWPKYFSVAGGKAAKSKAGFAGCVKGRKINGVERKGKNILIHLSGGRILLIHQKMTGHLLVGRWKESRRRKNKKTRKQEDKWEGERWVPESHKKTPLWDVKNRYIHFILFLGGGKMIALSDMRKFAKILCGAEKDIKNLPELRELGPDPTRKSFGVDDFKEIIKKVSPSKRIKQALLDQTVIAGIGNIYADESLWLAKIHPETPMENLTDKKINKLCKSIKEVLEKAVKLKGTSVDDYRGVSGKRGRYGDVRRVYQREGERCFRCSSFIKRIKIGNRSAHFCPKCQGFHNK